MKVSTKYQLLRFLVCWILILAAGAFSLFAQQMLPDIPDLIRVTVDHSDSGVLIQWEASTDTDIEYYTVYREQDQAFVQVATVSASEFEYKHPGGAGQQIAYAVTATDSAGNESLFEQNVHRAVFLTAEFDPCTPSNNLAWNGYMGWDDNISGYRIYGGTDPASMQLLTFVSPDTRAWSHTAVTAGSVYHYYIETVHTSGMVSLSPVAQISSLYPDPPQYLAIDFVSVIDPFSVELQFTADITGAVKDFRIQKRSDPGTPFTDVTTLWDAQQSTLVIQDQFPTSSTSYEYRVQSIYQPSGCITPVVLSTSNPGNSILLSSGVTDQVVNLNWIPYETYDEGNSGYLIQRKSGDAEFYDIETVGPSTTSWSEDIQSVINGFQPGELQYKVLAIENPSGAGDPGISISNTVSVYVETSLQVPTAITPGSNDMNAEFRPMIDFAPRKYLLMVLDRSGRKVFEATDPGEAWDGRSPHGDFVKEGVYVYYIQYTDYTGLFRSMTGNVTVLYP